MAGHIFATERIRSFRERPLDELPENTVTHIETFGCSVIHVKPNGVGPGWSYTIGVFDTCGEPEVLVVGLRQETAHFLLNETASLLRRKVDLLCGRHRDLVGEVECEFRPVDPRWAAHLMGLASWYYQDAAYPVIQAVYPDLENRFPEDEGFDVRFAQPLLQPNRTSTQLETDFWASADPRSSLFDWKFAEPPHTPVFLSVAVQSGEEKVTYVSHDREDGAWQFLGDSMTGGKPPVISCFHHPIDRDRSLEELADLPAGWWAERAAPGEPWIRHVDESEPGTE